jgi:hypothetical protein
MSIKLMSWVLDNSPYEGKGRLVHLVLADHANDQGICWPSQTTIAARAGCSTEHVRVVVKQMVTDGYVQIIEESHGPGSSTRYQLKNPKSVGASDEIPQVHRQIPQVQRPNTPSPSPKNHKNHKEPSVDRWRCVYCGDWTQSGAHDCSAMNMRLR